MNIYKVMENISNDIVENTDIGFEDFEIDTDTDNNGGTYWVITLSNGLSYDYYPFGDDYFKDLCYWVVENKDKRLV